jgi:putative ABC transport system permease protein
MRVLFEGIKIAFGALMANKLRTSLTLLGNIVGIMAVIAVVSLLGGVDDYMREEVASEGSNVFSIERVNVFDAITDFDGFLEALRRNPRLERGDVEALRERLTLSSHVSGRVSTRTRVLARDRSVDGIAVRGNDREYPFVENVPLYAGRHLVSLEDRESAQVVVIGWDVYEALIAPRAPIGERIRIGDRHFRVVGVAADRGSLLGQSQNRFVIIPLGAYFKLFGPRQSLEIKVRADDIRRMEDAIAEATVAMRIIHRLRPADEDDFFVSTSEQLITIWRNISSGVMIALISLVSISLVVGGIVLMNTMLVSVTERTREVGIRKALGARRVAIVWQFLVESATLSVCGGAVGMAIGFAIASAVSLLTVLPYVINPGVVAIAFVVTVVIGLVFGTYPAIKAARLDPVEALRAE